MRQQFTYRSLKYLYTSKILIGREIFRSVLLCWYIVSSCIMCLSIALQLHVYYTSFDVMNGASVLLGIVCYFLWSRDTNKDSVQ